jgi:hypothetical protein
MFRTCICLLGVLAVTLITTSVSGQPLVNRKIDRLAITPSETGPVGTWDVHVVWTVAVDGTSAGLDLSSSISLFVGPPEVPYASTVVDITTDVTFDCFNGCAGGCGGGYIDGVFNTMLCLNDPPSCESCDCDCQFPWLTTTLPGLDLASGSDLTVIIGHDTGAVPEQPGADNTRELEFLGEPVYWDVTLTAVDLISHATAPDTYDVKATWDFEVGNLAQEAYFAVEAVLYVDGEQQASELSCDWITAPPSACVLCSGICGTAESSCGDQDMTCMLGEYICACRSDPQCIVIPGVLLLPGEGVEVRLIPVPGALPPLPPLGEDDRILVTVPAPCPADIDGSGSVGLPDLLALLSAWGPCPGAPEDCPEDLNGDDVVGLADLLQLLAAWGPC